VIFDYRTYKCIPGRTAAQLKLYGELAYPTQIQYLGEPVCWMVTETGVLNSLVHVWAYDSAADREQKRARLAKDPAWQHYLVENGKAGNIADQHTMLMTPAPFAPKITLQTNLK
jgi:NIPSNAP